MMYSSKPLGSAVREPKKRTHRWARAMAHAVAMPSRAVRGSYPYRRTEPVQAVREPVEPVEPVTGDGRG